MRCSHSRPRSAVPRSAVGSYYGYLEPQARDNGRMPLTPRSTLGRSQVFYRDHGMVR